MLKHMQRSLNLVRRERMSVAAASAAGEPVGDMPRAWPTHLGPSQLISFEADLPWWVNHHVSPSRSRMFISHMVALPPPVTISPAKARRQPPPPSLAAPHHDHTEHLPGMQTGLAWVLGCRQLMWALQPRSNTTCILCPCVLGQWQLKTEPASPFVMHALHASWHCQEALLMHVP